MTSKNIHMPANNLLFVVVELETPHEHNRLILFDSVVHPVHDIGGLGVVFN